MLLTPRNTYVYKIDATSDATPVFHAEDKNQHSKISQI